MMNAQWIARFVRYAVVLLLGMSVVFATNSSAAQDREREKDPLLSEADIDLIKVYEVDLDSDPPPRVVIPTEKLREFLKEYQEDDRVPRGKQKQDQWVRSEGYKQLELFFQLRARDYYNDVRVRSKVQSLRDWSNVHRRYVLSYFQPTFGSGQVEGLYLFPRGREAERIELTNFYILTQVLIDGSSIIDRNSPEESLLVQWGLPRESAKFPAPEVAGWQPKFKDTDDKRFVEKVDWIKSLIAENQGSAYGITYEMPRHKKPRD